MPEVNPSDYSPQEIQELLEICKKQLGFKEPEHSVQLGILRELLEQDVNDIREAVVAAGKSPNPDIIFDKIHDQIREKMVAERGKGDKK